MTESARAVVDVVFVGGRVIDPASGTDAVRCVGVRGSEIVYIGEEEPAADRRIDVSGCVVSPGFIDLHSHAQSVTGLRLQAMDGVTTALDLEGGAVPVASAYARAEEEGRPINFGFSAGWLAARLHVLDDLPLWREMPPGLLPTSLHYAGAMAGHARRAFLPAQRRDVDRLVDLLDEELGAGAIGIGALLGYAPQSGRDEYARLAMLAASRSVPVFTHPRTLSEIEPDTSLASTLEVIGVAGGTGAAMHLCHINSSSLRLIDEITTAVAHAQDQGLSITTEAYPYGTGSTSIGAEYLAPELLPRMGLTPRSIRYLRSGERVVDTERLQQLRAEDPGGLCTVDILDEEDPADLRMLLEGIVFPGTAIASDAMPLIPLDPSEDGPDAAWPPREGRVTHPRSAGCFARTLGWVVREQGALPLAEAIRRCTFVPAQLLAESVPAMRAKGRLQVDADADITVFDPATVSERATMTYPQPSSGFAHVMVGGQFVVTDGQLDPRAFPGRAVRTR